MVSPGSLTAVDKPSLITDYGHLFGKLKFDQTLPCSLVHKRSVGEVLLTDLVLLDERTVLAGAYLPKTHAFYNYQRREFIDELLMVEIARQTGLAASHRFFDVPESHKGLASRLETKLLDPQPLRGSSAVANCTAVQRVDIDSSNDGSTHKMSWTTSIYIDGVEARTVSGQGSFVPDHIHDALRKKMSRSVSPQDRQGTPSLAQPEAIGRADVHHVAISEPKKIDGPEVRFVSELVIDETNPFYFDHHLDHAPGFLLMEAARQLAFAASCRQFQLKPTAVIVKEMDAKFRRYAELHAPVTLEATMVKPQRDEDTVSDTTVEFAQAGRQVAEIRYVFAYDT